MIDLPAIEGHGGQISIASENDATNHGTIVRVFLPMRALYDVLQDYGRTTLNGSYALPASISESLSGNPLTLSPFIRLRCAFLTILRTRCHPAIFPPLLQGNKEGEGP